MSYFAVLMLCIQACLVQNVFSQACGAHGLAMAPAYAGPCGLAAPGLAYDGLAYPATGLAAAYGGAGEGNVAVTGELPVAGNTAVTGQVPIMGAVGFGGPVAACGTMSITGQCECGCGGPYY